MSPLIERGALPPPCAGSPRVSLATATLIASLLAACGGGGGSDAPSGSPVASSPPGTTAPSPGATPTPAPTPATPTPAPTPSPTPPPAPTPAPTPPPSANEVARLFDQSGFGPTDSAVAAVQGQGIATYLDAQFATPSTGYAAIDFIDANSAVGCPTGAAATCFRDNYTAFPVQLQFYRNALTGADQLRQRVALAYSQIFVISAIDIKPAYGMRAYQQMLLDNSFVNFRQLLERVTLHPAMGDYLDMVNNNKPTATVQANENYAREVLQLFSIGLSKLNADGSTVNDGNGVPVPSYDQSVVQAFARAFTGWTYAARPGATSGWTNPVNYLGDMVSFDTHHDSTAAKTLLDGKVVPAGQSAAKDLSDALDAIYNHPNVGPFIGKQMIEALVTSNPTPAYVARVTAVFNDNGQGVRGDMKAVIRAILLDSEARGDVKTDASYGKLRDPAVYVASVERAYGGTSDGVYLNAQSAAMGQSVFTPGSVFNFYPPDYALPNSGTLKAPQFGVENTTTSVARFNFVYALLNTTVNPDGTVAGSTGTQVNLTSLAALAGTPAAMVDKLDASLTHTTMTASEKAAITTAVSTVAASDGTGRARMAAYLFAISPRYLITR